MKDGRFQADRASIADGRLWPSRACDTLADDGTAPGLNDFIAPS
jgi:hypothetical protein